MGVGKYVLNDAGEPVEEPDVLAWGLWMQSAHRHVADEAPIPGVRVSTVFIGLDHNFGDGPPLLWETMIFGGAYDQETWRYTTRAEAEAGHRRAVERVIEGTS